MNRERVAGLTVAVMLVGFAAGYFCGGLVAYGFEVSSNQALLIGAGIACVALGALICHIRANIKEARERVQYEVWERDDERDSDAWASRAQFMRPSERREPDGFKEWR